MFLPLPGYHTSGIFSPSPVRDIFVYPPGKEWEDREAWSLEYVQLKCAEFKDKEDFDAGHKCVIVE